MATRRLTPLDLTGNEIRNVVAQNLASAPGTPSKGQFYFDTTANILYWYNGTSWVAAQGGTPSGAAGGDLTGTYPNPTIAANAVTSTKINVSSVATALLLTGTISARPAAAAGNSGLYYFSTDSNGGTLFQSTGSGWTQLTRGVSEVELIANKNAANGYAGLNGSSQVALAQIPVASSGTSSSTQVVRADDSRLSDNRTPLANSVVDASVSSSAAIAFSKIAAPIAATPWNSQKITGLADPTNPQDAATKNYVDSLSTGLDFKASVRAATTAALPTNTYSAGVLTASANGILTIDGYSPTTGERILVKNEATGANNGYYVVTNPGAAGAAYVLTRSSDMNSTANTSAGAMTYVESGTVNAGTQWILSTTGSITIGTTSLTFTQFSGASTATAGAGLIATGNVFAVGQGTGISVAADAISVDTTVVVRKYAVSIGDGSATSYVVTHNLGTQDVIVEVYYNSAPFDHVDVDIQHTSTNTITILFGVAPATNAYRVVVHG